MSDEKKIQPKAEAKPGAKAEPEAKSAAEQAATPAAAPTPAAPPRPVMYLPANLFKSDEHSCHRFHAVAPAEHTIEDVLNANYLKHVNVARMQRHDRVIIDHAEGNFSIELYIWDPDAETGKIAFFVDAIHDRLQQQLVRDDLRTAKIEQRGAHFAVENEGRILKGGFPTRKMAEAWLDMKRGGQSR